MNAKVNSNAQLEVSSAQLKAELIEIKERVAALETIASISNRDVVEAYVRSQLKTDKGKLIMRECEAPRTREYLISKLSLKSAPALDYHLTPLREADLIQQHLNEDGTQIFAWSNLFKRLPKKTIREIVNGSA